MLVFIDESGDPGLKLGSGSSEHFVVTLLIFQDYDEANRADEKIVQLRKQLGLSEQYEFKFSKLAPKHKVSFLEEMVTHDFFYFSLAVNKEMLFGAGFQFKESFYKYAYRLVFENAKPYLTSANVVIDGSGSREFKRQLGVYLKKQINEKDAAVRCIRKVKMEDSQTNNLLQLVDMVCGAVARSFKTDKTDCETYRKIIRQREKHVQFWPK
jgi:hypothetical protein